MKKVTRIISMLLCIMLAASLCACGGVETAKNGEAKELVWYLLSSEPKGFAEVEAKVNEYLLEEMGFTVDIQCIEPADYGQKCQLALASGEAVDMLWTSTGAFPYENNVAKGAFMPLEDVLKNEVPEMWEYYSEDIWEATKVSGMVYGIPMEQIFHVQRGYSFITSIAEKYGLVDRIKDLAWVDEDTHGSYEELEEIFDIVREGEPSDFVMSSNGDIIAFRAQRSQVGGYDVVDGKALFDTELSIEDATRARRWNEKGYFPANAATIEDTNIYSNEGKEFTRYNRYLPGVEGKWRISHTYDSMIIPVSDAVINRGGIQSTLTALSANCRYPKECVQLIYRTHTDPYLLNLICYGIEGRDYNLIPDTNPQRMERASGAYYLAEFLVGSQFMAYLVPSYEDDVWEQTRYENETAKIDEYIGFSFDPSPVESEISQVSAVNAEYYKIITYGLDDPNVIIPEREEKAKLAGRDVVIGEINRQLDAWRAEQK